MYIFQIIEFLFQPVLVTLSSKSDPLWRDYERQCLTESQSGAGSGNPGPGHNNLLSPSFASQNPNEVADMILQVKTENPSDDFTTVFPDSSSSVNPPKSSTTMWEDIASSIKKLDPDHADVLSALDVGGHQHSTTATLPPVSTVVSGNASDYYQHQQPPQSAYSANFNDQDIFNNTGSCKYAILYLSF